MIKTWSDTLFNVLLCKIPQTLICSQLVLHANNHCSKNTYWNNTSLYKPLTKLPSALISWRDVFAAMFLGNGPVSCNAQSTKNVIACSTEDGKRTKVLQRRLVQIARDWLWSLTYSDSFELLWINSQQARDTHPVVRKVIRITVIQLATGLWHLPCCKKGQALEGLGDTGCHCQGAKARPATYITAECFMQRWIIFTQWQGNEHSQPKKNCTVWSAFTWVDGGLLNNGYHKSLSSHSRKKCPSKEVVKKSYQKDKGGRGKAFKRPAGTAEQSWASADILGIAILRSHSVNTTAINRIRYHESQIMLNALQRRKEGICRETHRQMGEKDWQAASVVLHRPREGASLLSPIEV